MSSTLGRVTTGLAVVALAVPALAVANGRGHGHGHGHGETFTLHAVQITDEFIDLGAPGISVGDQAVFATALSRDGRPYGTTGGSCAVTIVNSDGTFTASCHAESQTNDGLTATQALVTFRNGLQPPFKLAITGGTGRFSGAGGEVEVRQITDTTEDYIVRLDRR
jgi:Allene oxide cyclase barrel like domain